MAHYSEQSSNTKKRIYLRKLRIIFMRSWKWKRKHSEMVKHLPLHFPFLQNIQWIFMHINAPHSIWFILHNFFSPLFAPLQPLWFAHWRSMIETHHSKKKQNLFGHFVVHLIELVSCSIQRSIVIHDSALWWVFLFLFFLF